MIEQNKIKSDIKDEISDVNTTSIINLDKNLEQDKKNEKSSIEINKISIEIKDDTKIIKDNEISSDIKNPLEKNNDNDKAIVNKEINENDKKNNSKHFINVEKGKYPEKSDEHMVTSDNLLDIHFDENYEYVIKKPIKKFFTTIYWGLAVILLKAFNKIVFNFKIIGKDKFKALKKKKIGFLTVSNHCLMADCTMINSVTFPNKVYLPTIHTTFQLPYIRHLVKGLNAIPIPEGIKAMSKFMSEIDNLLKEGKIVHFYPESALWPWYDKVREFKTGAFRFAVMNNVPILPMCFKFEERKGLHKLIFKKPMVRMYILDPIYPNMTINKKQAVNELCDKTHNIIKEFVENKN